MTNKEADALAEETTAKLANDTAKYTNVPMKFRRDVAEFLL